MRQGECSGLTVDRIDLLRRTVRVDRQLVLLPRKPPFLAPPKTSASHRTIPLPNVVVTALAEHIRHFPVSHPDGLVITDDDGEAPTSSYPTPDVGGGPERWVNVGSPDFDQETDS